MHAPMTDAVDVPDAIEPLRAPFPWFGGKRRVAHLVWERFGEVDSYNEPFAGSLAVLLGRPHAPRIETVNDLDCYLANFWRALQHDPEGVAYYADSPVNEADLHARHRWLVERARPHAERVQFEPDFYDVKVAGWWVWGQCLWIGSGWCQAPGSEKPHEQRKRPASSRTGTSVGVHRKDLQQFDRNGAGTTHQRRRPHLTSDQGALAGTHNQARRPHLLRDKGVAARRWQGGGQAGGSGVHAPRLTAHWSVRPDLSAGEGRGLVASEGLYAYLTQLASRLRRVRVCCGDWARILTPSVTTYIGVTGVFLDPPYAHDLRERCYSEDHNISDDVRRWALEHGDDPKMRIALCGYEGEHDMPSSWSCLAWKAHGGYSRTERGRANRDRERIWFSPHCLQPGAGPLFAEVP